MTVRKYIPCFSPDWGDEERSAIMQHIARDQYITSGKAVDKFEREFGKLHGRLAVMTNSGSSALLLATVALDLPRGSYVVTPAVTFPTTISPLLHLGHIPVFVDVIPGTYNIDPEQAVEAADKHNTSAAVIPHTLGNPVQPSLFDHFTHTVEDACDALDSTFDDAKCGTFGTYSTFSFFGAHHLCTGEGGMVLTKSYENHKKLYSLCNWGRSCICRPGENDRCGNRFNHKLPEGDLYCHKYSFDYPGFNLKPMEAQGVAGLVQLHKADRMTAIRKRNFGIINSYLNSVQDRVYLPQSHKEADPNWFGYPVTLKKGDRNKVVRNLETKGIQTRMVFAGNITRHKMMQGYKYVVPYPLVQSDIVMRQSFVVGLGPTITESEAHKIGRCVYEEIAT